MTLKARPVTLTPIQTSVHVNDKPVWEYSYEDLTFNGVKPKDIKGIAASMETMYKTTASIFENFINDLGMSTVEAMNILPRGLTVNKVDKDPDQKEFSFEKCA